MQPAPARGRRDRHAVVNFGQIDHGEVWGRHVSRPHVNDAPNVPSDANAPERTPAKVNCSLCTTAALVTYATGRAVSSGDVASTLAGGGPGVVQGNDNFSGGGRQEAVDRKARRQGMNVTDGTKKGTTTAQAASMDISGINQKQYQGMQRFCVGQQLRVDAPEGQQTLRSALDWMRLQPEGTYFGVLLESEGHWNVAKTYIQPTGLQGVSFADFQTDHAELGNGPVMGPRPQEGVARKTFDDLDAKVMVFAVTAPPPHTAQADDGAM